MTSNNSNDSTVQFHDQFLGFVKQKNESPPQPAVQSKSKTKSIDCSNVLPDYSADEDDNDDSANNKIHFC